MTVGPLPSTVKRKKGHAEDTRSERSKGKLIYYFVPLENFYYAYRLIFPIDLIELYKPLLMELTTQLSVSSRNFL